MNKRPLKHYELPERKKGDSDPMTLQDVIGICIFALTLAALIYYFG